MTGEAPERAFPGAEPPEVLRGYYAQMALIRAFQLRVAEMYQRAKIGGYCHPNLGEGATVVGLMAALEERDHLFTTYRERVCARTRGAQNDGRCQVAETANPRHGIGVISRPRRDA